MLNNQLFNDEDSHTEIVQKIRDRLHTAGPISNCDLETLAILKFLNSPALAQFETDILHSMGLFFKDIEASNPFSLAYSIFKQSILASIGTVLTPVQADAYDKINKNQNFSFSSPTSTGKSYLFHTLIQNVDGDIVIVAPSRALLAEYILKIKNSVTKNITVLPFIELVNTKRTKKNIFVVTPERSSELFKNIKKLNIKLILIDEAQLSENKGIRGMRLDAFVRRANLKLPNARKVFAHPFVSNPEAQLEKHSINEIGSYRCYQQNSVGKIFLYKKNDCYSFFSPYRNESVTELKYAGDPIINILSNGGTCFIYIPKNSILKRTFTTTYKRYIEACNKVKDKEAISIINSLKEYFGVNEDKKSLIIEMLMKGIVLHHGSMPLKARSLLEKFINKGYAKICFATSTLIQGINMPFDLVWICNYRFSKDTGILDLKNLIGRAGRSTQSKHYDYGFVIIDKSNVDNFTKRIQKSVIISNTSKLDDLTNANSEDILDEVEAIKEDAYNDELNIPNSQVDRLSNDTIFQHIRNILDNLFVNGKIINSTKFYELSEKNRCSIKQSLAIVYSSHLRRNSLTSGEESVLRASVSILLWHIQGKSFAEMLSLRYAYLSESDERKRLKKRLNLREITNDDYDKALSKLKIKTSYQAHSLPDFTYTKPLPLFKHGTSVKNIDFDTILYDTYDYLDKVISLSLSTVLGAAFSIYANTTNDQRAVSFVKYLSYGTNDDTIIWLIKYGFELEDIDWIYDKVEAINADEIIFKSDSLATLSLEQYLLIKKYL